MNFIKITLISTVLMIFSGCSWTNDFLMKEEPELNQQDSENVKICRVPLDAQYPDSVSWRNVRVYVLNEKKMKGIINNNKEYVNMPDVYIAFSADGYENLSLNIGEMKYHIQEQRSLINRLMEYYSKKTKGEQNDNDSGSNNTTNGNNDT